MENPKEPSKKLLELINEFSKVSSYKTSIYQLHFYTLIMNNPKIKLRRQFYLCSMKKNKIFWIECNKRGVKLCTQNYKTSLKEIKDLNKKKDSLCSLTG